MTFTDDDSPNGRREYAFTDDDWKKLKDSRNNGPHGTGGMTVVLTTNLDALLARLEAAEAYKEAHPCGHREPHGATCVTDFGCEYDLTWRKAAGK